MKVLSEFQAEESGSIIEQDKRKAKGQAVSEASDATLASSTTAKQRYPGAFSSNEPTPFEKAGRPGSEAIENCPDALRNVRDPYYLIQHEKAVHRMMAYLHVRGDTNKEIAEATGYTAVAVSNILRQPGTQVFIAEETKKLGGQEVTVVLRGKALAAVQRLVKEMDNETTGSSQSRIASANAILDRVFGKPNQPITHIDGGSVDDMSDEEISKRLKELEAQRTN